MNKARIRAHCMSNGLVSVVNRWMGWAGDIRRCFLGHVLGHHAILHHVARTGLYMGSRRNLNADAFGVVVYRSLLPTQVAPKIYRMAIEYMRSLLSRFSEARFHPSHFVFFPSFRGPSSILTSQKPRNSLVAAGLIRDVR